MIRPAILLSFALVACEDNAGTLAYVPPAPGPQEAGWPDTTAAPYVPLDQLLRPPFGSGTYLTDGVLTRLDLCPPCPPGAHCEPCPPEGFIVESMAPGGTASIRVEGTQRLPSPATLVENTHILMTLDVGVWRQLERFHRAEIEDSTEYVTYTLKGIRPLNRRPYTDRVWPFDD